MGLEPLRKAKATWVSADLAYSSHHNSILKLLYYYNRIALVRENMNINPMILPES